MSEYGTAKRMVEVRCRGCGKLLAKAEGTGTVEVKCARCKDTTTARLVQPRG